MSEENKYLERARERYSTCSDEEKDLLEGIFPELIETDDEGIIETLVSLVIECNYQNSAVVGRRGIIEKDDIIAWIEKNRDDYSGFTIEQQRYMKKYIPLGKVTLVKLLAERDMNVESILQSFKEAREDEIFGWLDKHAGDYMKGEYNEFHHTVEYEGFDKDQMIKDLKTHLSKTDAK